MRNKTHAIADTLPVPHHNTIAAIYRKQLAQLTDQRDELLSALEICRREIDSAQNNMIANGYEKHSMPLKMLSYASLLAADAIAKARGQA